MAQAPNEHASPSPLELKGGMFTLTVLRLLSADLDRVAGNLAEKVGRAPALFRNAPVVIDLQGLPDPGVALDFTTLIAIARGHGMLPVAVRGGSALQQEAALNAGLGVLPPGRDREARARMPAPTLTPTSTPEPAARTVVASTNRVILQPVRSGQQVYAQGGDLIVMAPVSIGAEVLADGNIHVYAPLRGRALAGVQGDERARIFSQCLEPELVSIAGHYRVIEELEPEVRGKAAQVYLDEGRLMIRLL